MTVKGTPKELLEMKDAKFDFSKVLILSKKYWYIYLSTILVFIGLGALFIHIKAPTYEVEASIILNDNDDDSKGSLGGGLGALMASFSMGGSSYKYVDDEIRRITSYHAVLQMVKDLRLNEKYTGREGFFSTRMPYFQNSPITVFIPSQVLDTISVTTVLKIAVSSFGYDITLKQGKKYKTSKIVKDLPTAIKTPYGNFIVNKAPGFQNIKNMKFTVILENPKITVESIRKKLNIGSPSKKSSIIDLSYKDTSIERAKDIINTLISIYNNQSLADIRSQAGASLKFVEERLIKLYSELESSERQIEAYKKANKIVDAEAEAEYIFKKKQALETGKIEYESKAGVASLLLDFLKDPANQYQLIPFAEGMSEDAVTEYNKLVLDRIKLQENAKGNNAVLKGITAQVDAMRYNMINSLEKQIAATNIVITDLNRDNAGSDSRIAGIPSIERNLLSLYRDQKIKNQIYAFLLQKREENELKLSRMITTGKYIDEAYENIEPVSPNKVVVFLIAILSGILGAYVLILLIDGISKKFLSHRTRLTE